MKIKFAHLIMAGGVCLAASAFVIDKPKPKPHRKFIDPANMNLAVKPGDDFFEYANGTWVKTTLSRPKQPVGDLSAL
jgi:putative endopeptidase